MNIYTVRFGRVEVEEDRMIHFPSGIIGFSSITEYALFQHKENSPFLWLQAVKCPELAFFVADPFAFFQDYQVILDDETLSEMNLNSGTPQQDLAIYGIVTVPRGQPEKISVNLLAPVVVHVPSKKGKQVILPPDRYSTKHYLLPQLQMDNQPPAGIRQQIEADR